MVTSKTTPPILLFRCDPPLFRRPPACGRQGLLSMLTSLPSQRRLPEHVAVCRNGGTVALPPIRLRAYLVPRQQHLPELEETLSPRTSSSTPTASRQPQCRRSQPLRLASLPESHHNNEHMHTMSETPRSSVFSSSSSPASCRPLTPTSPTCVGRRTAAVCARPEQI